MRAAINTQTFVVSAQTRLAAANIA